MRVGFSSLIALCLVLVSACGGNVPSTPHVEAGIGGDAAALKPKVLRFGISAADLRALDPHFATSTPDRTVVSMVFNGLIRYKPGEAPELEPDLAVSLPVPVLEGGRQVWTFELRRGIMCHPGPKSEAYELTAGDVVYSLQKSANPDRSAFADEYAGMSFEQVGDYSVRISLAKPMSPVLFFPKVADYGGGFIVCRRAVEAMGDEAIKTYPVGTGPFIFDRYTPQDRVRLTANRDFFRGQPKLAAVELRYIPDASSRDRGLRTGQLDVISGVDEPQWLNSTRATENLLVDVFGVGEVLSFHFNTTVPPMDDLLVRKAIAYALNREEFLALHGHGAAESVFSPVPDQFIMGGVGEAEATELGLDYNYDPERARELLAEAGFPEGFSLEVVSSELEPYRSVYASMQAQLARVGILLHVDVVDHATMHSRIRQTPIPIVAYNTFRPNADSYLTRYFHSDAIIMVGATPDTNFSHYNQIDMLIDSARAETDAGIQIELWKQAQVKILEDMVAHTILAEKQVYARRASVDYGHPMKAIPNLNPLITEKTQLLD
jgi:peptide/nickel transport system substrate-binding protein